MAVTAKLQRRRRPRLQSVVPCAVSPRLIVTSASDPSRRWWGVEAVACPSSSLCFAVGHAVAFGAGNALGVPLIERWDGHRWNRVPSPPATGPFTSISCPSAHECTAVGGFENAVGTPTATTNTRSTAR
jgi:hypothetical protein